MTTYHIFELDESQALLAAGVERDRRRRPQQFQSEEEKQSFGDVESALIRCPQREGQQTANPHQPESGRWQGMSGHVFEFIIACVDQQVPFACFMSGLTVDKSVH